MINTHSDDWFVPVVLATLLTLDPNNEILELSSLEFQKDPWTELTVLVEPFYNTSPIARKTLLEWLRIYGNSEVAPDILFELLHIEPEFFHEHAIVWLKNHPEHPKTDLLKAVLRLD